MHGRLDQDWTVQISIQIWIFLSLSMTTDIAHSLRDHIALRLHATQIPKKIKLKKSYKDYELF